MGQTCFSSRAVTLSLIILMLIGCAAGGGGVSNDGSSSSSSSIAAYTIGTGRVTGVYYPAGGAICRLTNNGYGQGRFFCSVESTRGSIYNINSIRSGQLHFGMAQSDWHYHAYHGTSYFDGWGEFFDLRSVFSLHAEPVTLVVRADSDIRNIRDLAGKRINMGAPRSGTRGVWDLIQEAHGWRADDFAELSEIKVKEAGGALCNDEIDAYFWLVGHPSTFTDKQLIKCQMRLVQVSGEAIDRLVAEYPYFRKTRIPAEMYNNDTDIATFGVGATFVTSTAMPEDVVYSMVKSVFENLDELRQMHPGFRILEVNEMISATLVAPLHQGAIRYYRERGWM